MIGAVSRRMFTSTRRVVRQVLALSPVGLARNLGFSASELRRIERLVSAHQSELLERWYAEYGRTPG